MSACFASLHRPVLGEQQKSILFSELIVSNLSTCSSPRFSLGTESEYPDNPGTLFLGPERAGDGLCPTPASPTHSLFQSEGQSYVFRDNRKALREGTQSPLALFFSPHTPQGLSHILMWPWGTENRDCVMSSEPLSV